MSFVSGPASPADPRGDRLDRIGIVGAYLIALFALGFLRKIDWGTFDAGFFRTRFGDYLWIIFAGSAYSFRLRALLQEGRSRPSAGLLKESG